jgi:hypothetical protein
MGHEIWDMGNEIWDTGLKNGVWEFRVVKLETRN